MKIITGLSEQPKQQSTLVLADGTRAVWSISYVAQQTGWFYDLSWNGTVIATGQRMVSSPNILRQYINKISFGIAVISPNQLEPTTQTALVDGTVTCYLLEGTDLQTIETTLFNAPAGQVQPVATTPAGAPVVVLPANWGPAGGDLAYAYPNPQVVAMHDNTGQRLAFGTVADGRFLKRDGANIIGATVAPGTGDVSGPASSTIGNVAVWADAAGTELSDGGTLGTAAFLPSSNFLGATAAATGDLAGNFPSPRVAAIHTTTGGGTKLTIGAVADGQYLVRSGSTLIGSTPSGAGDVFGPSSTVTVGTVALFAATDGKLLGPSGITLGSIASQPASSVNITGGNISLVSITGSTAALTGLTVNTTTPSSYGSIEVSGTAGAFIDLKAPDTDDFDLRLITGGGGGQIVASGDTGIEIITNNVQRALINTSGLAVTGAISATSAITASNFSGSSSGTNTGNQTISITGDVTAANSTGVLTATVTKINGVSLAELATGILKNTSTTGVPSIAIASDFPTLNQNTTGTAANVSGVVAIANGGTGAASAAAARTALGATTLGANVFSIANPSAITFPQFNADNTVSSLSASALRTALGATTLGANVFSIPNPSAITFPRFNADNTVSSLSATDFRTAIGAGTSSTTGTVTSVGGTGSVNGITLTGTVTSSGSLSLGGTLSNVNLTSQVTGTLPVGNGGTGATTAATARTGLGATTLGSNVFTIPNPGAITFPRFNADNTVSSLSATDFRTAIGAGTSSTTGTVTSVGGTGSVNGITLTGTVTSSGSLSLGGTLSGVSLTSQVAGILPSANGGTGNGFTKFIGPTTSEKTFTLPNQSAELIYSGGNAALSIVQIDQLKLVPQLAYVAASIVLDISVSRNRISLTQNLTVTDTSNRQNTVSSMLELYNTTAGNLTLSWSQAGTWKTNGALPTTIGPGETMQFLIQCWGINESDVSFNYISPSSFPKLNVRAFGAKGDGSTDDSSAFQKAVDAAVSLSTGGCVYIPSGRYRLNSRIVKTGISLPKSLSIIGDGQGVSVLSSYSTDGVFQISFAATTQGAQNALLLADFSVNVETTGATAATGLDLSWASSVSSTFQCVEIRGITFNPNSDYSGVGYFQRYLKINNAWNAKIHDCLVRGPNSIPAGLTACVGLEIATSDGSESNPIHITDCDFYQVTIGVYVSGRIESACMDQCIFLGDYGVYASPDIAQEHLSVSNCHASNKFYSVYATNMYRAFVHDNVFFGDNGSSSYIGIYLGAGSPFSKLHDNYIRGNGGNGIVTTSGNQTVHSNTFIGLATGYWMQGGTNNSIAYANNIFTSDAGTPGGTSVLDQGSGNNVFNNY
jgi:hypothetical protein